MAALDILVVANTSSPHYFGGPLRAVSLNRLYFSHLRSDQLETCCITFRGIKKSISSQRMLQIVSLEDSIFLIY